MSMLPPNRSAAPALLKIDAHAHVFGVGGPLAALRRYTPTVPRPEPAYRAELDAAGITHALLVQPSFLGTDNTTLLRALAERPARYRGVAVVDPDVDDETLDHMAALGVVGVRYNIIGWEAGALLSAPWQTLSRRIASLGWHIEVQAEGPDVARLLPVLLEHGGPVVIDHFGKPAPADGVADAGFQAILAQGRAGAPVWAKLSGPYRCGADVQPYAEALLEALGPKRLMWGSDWPWTQNEAGKTYGACLRWLEDWVPDETTRAAVLAAPARLMGLPG